MLGRLDSLNVSVSAAILLIEAASTRSASPSRRHPLLRGRPPGARSHRSSRGIQPTRYQQHTHFHPPYFQGVFVLNNSHSVVYPPRLSKGPLFCTSVLHVLVYASWSMHFGLPILVFAFRSARSGLFREERNGSGSSCQPVFPGREGCNSSGIGAGGLQMRR